MKITIELDVDEGTCEALVREPDGTDLERHVLAQTIRELFTKLRLYVASRMTQEGLPAD